MTAGARDEVGWPASPHASLSVEFVEGHLRCLLNRPERRNALSPELLFALAAVIDDAGQRDDVCVVSLRGVGDRAFSAGFDIKILAERGAAAHAGNPMEKASMALRRCAAPTFAVIDGVCVGAGLDLALCCDFRLATSRSTFSLPATRLGTVYPPRAIGRILRDLGPAACKELFLLGRQIDPARACKLGIVQEVVAPGEIDHALAQWTDLPASAAFAVRAHKRIIETLLAEQPSDGLYEQLGLLRTEALARPERASAIDGFVRGPR
ncbi:MAG TPA: enoyl-CoA hydratase/isomerase family protein [Rhodoblastus sp.]|nr:enoyl-CoA hydratase/isomerase family protein [Rhodoblastus sp.]